MGGTAIPEAGGVPGDNKTAEVAAPVEADHDATTVPQIEAAPVATPVEAASEVTATADGPGI